MKLTDEKVEITIMASGKSSRFFSEFCKNVRKNKDILYRKPSKNKLEIAFKTPDSREGFLWELESWIVNGFLAFEIIDYCFKNKLAKDEGRAVVYLDTLMSMEDPMLYFYTIAKKNLEFYLKNNSVIDIDLYWKYNMASMIPDLKTVLNSQQFLELLRSNEASDIINDNDSFIRFAISSATECCLGEFPQEVRVFNDEDEVLICDENDVLYSPLVFPEEMMAAEISDELPLEKYILLMLIVVSPKKATIYKMDKDLDPEGTLFDKLNELILFCAENYPQVLENVQIYFDNSVYIGGE